MFILSKLTENMTALLAPKYVGHQIDHVLTIIEEPMNFLGGRVHVCYALALASSLGSS